MINSKDVTILYSNGSRQTFENVISDKDAMQDGHKWKVIKYKDKNWAEKEARVKFSNVQQIILQDRYIYCEPDDVSIGSFRSAMDANGAYEELMFILRTEGLVSVKFIRDMMRRNYKMEDCFRNLPDIPDTKMYYRYEMFEDLDIDWNIRFEESALGYYIGIPKPEIFSDDIFAEKSETTSESND